MYFHLYVLDNLIMMMFVAELVHAFPCSLGRWPHLEREGWGFFFGGGDLGVNNLTIILC